MPLTPNCGRQSPVIAHLDLNLADLNSGAVMPAVVLPANAQILSLELNVRSGFNSGSSDSFDIGDAALPTRYGAGINVRNAGRSVLSPSGQANAGTVTVRWNSSGSPATLGSAQLCLSYFVRDRVEHTIG